MNGRTWLGVSAITVPLVIAMSALSVAVIRADRAERSAETVRLALWQLDAQAGALLVAEASRAPDAYEAFSVGADGRGVSVSPLLDPPSPPIALHLQMAEDGRLSSPQIPPARWRARACAGRTTAQAIATAESRLQAISAALAHLPGGAAQWQAQIPVLPSADDGHASDLDVTESTGVSAASTVPAPPPAAAPAVGELKDSSVRNDDLKKTARDFPRQELVDRTKPADTGSPSGWGGGVTKDSVPADVPVVTARTRSAPIISDKRQNESTIPVSRDLEYARRSSNNLQSQFYAVKSLSKTKEAQAPKDVQVSGATGMQDQAAPATSTASVTRPTTNIGGAANGIGTKTDVKAESVQFHDTAPAESGPMQARWLDDRLLLVRRARLGGHQVIQAAVVDWPVLRGQLLAPLSDRLPAARLVPAVADDALATRLATLPVRLIPGDMPAGPVGDAARWTLGMAWLGTVIGIVGAAVLLVLAHRLSERRAVFVSAVTHELRTPLTSLRLNADLLADVRIGGDELKRAGRIAALRSEAGRLAHLIDNVLDYARLERRQPPTPRPVVLTELLTPLLPRWQERLASVGLTLICESLPAVSLICDPAAVERILANLIDNTAKYAADGVDKRVVLRALLADRCVEVRLRDHGPGLTTEVRARLFVPFARSAEIAAGNAPGVGLGLALCQRLALAQRGDLQLVPPSDGIGLEAVLRLPLAAG